MGMNMGPESASHETTKAESGASHEIDRTRNLL